MATGSVFIEANTPGMIDLGKSYDFKEFEYPLVTGQEAAEEGLAFIARDEGGVRKVLPAVGDGDDKFVGFSKLGVQNISVFPAIQNLTVPSVAPYTLTLANNNLVAAQIRVFKVSDDSVYTEGNAANAGEYSVVDSTGVMTFNAAQAGVAVRIQYRFSPLARDVKRFLFERHLNRGDGVDLESVTLIEGVGAVVYTAQYNQNVTWVNEGGPPVVVKTAAGGKLTVGGAGQTIGTVYEAPSSSCPYLGVKLSVVT